MAPDRQTSSTCSKPWPEYFLVRTTGEIVPLVAVDELPPGTDILGVPRSLVLEETIGMLNLGLQRSEGGFYQFVTKARDRNCHRADEESDNERRNLGGRTPHGQPSPVPPSLLVDTSTSTPRLSIARSATRSSSIQPSLSPSPIAEKPKRSKQHTTVTNNTASQICRHWCQHGICKWGQRCRYQHIMPMTLHGIQAVGMNDWPSWYRRLNPDCFASSSTTTANNGSENRNARAERRAGGDRKYGIAGVAGRAYAQDREGSVKQRAVRGGGTGHQHLVAGGKKEDLAEQAVARLRLMSKDTKAEGERVKKKKASVVERAVEIGTQDWEARESGSDNDEAQNEVKVKGEVLRSTAVEVKLVDI